MDVFSIFVKFPRLFLTFAHTALHWKN
jgi:hypothetical protein